MSELTQPLGFLLPLGFLSFQCSQPWQVSFHVWTHMAGALSRVQKMVKRHQGTNDTFPSGRLAVEFASQFVHVYIGEEHLRMGGFERAVTRSLDSH